MLWRSRIGRVTPATLIVASRGHARLRVEGIAHGYVRVGSERRWRWGAFDETFVVALPKTSGAIEILCGGLGGRARQEVPCGPAINVAAPAVRATMPQIRAGGATPRPPQLRTRRFSAPRVLPLTKAPLQSPSQETQAKS